jgi:hypothetical protein
MLATIIFLSAIAVLLTVVWEANRKRRALKSSSVDLKPGGKAKWVFTIVCASAFLLISIAMCLEPPEPPFGSKGIVLHLAYLCVGKYGPALVFLILGFGCFVASEKQRRAIQKQ